MTADDEDFIVWEITDAHDFWNELSEYGHAPDDVTVLELDGRLKMFLRLCGKYHTRYLTDSLQFRTALELMVNSDLFRFHYVRMERVLIDFILITPDPHQLFVAYELLLRYGQSSDKFFKDCSSWRKLLPYWLDVIRNVQDGYFGEDDDGTGIAPIEIRLRYTVVCLLYEISRAQKLADEDLATFNSSFLDHLFDLVELTRDEADECFNYTIIKLLTSLNEQYMIRNLDSNSVRSQHLQISNNLVLNVLTRRLGTSKTFGENLIFILNRASDCREDICVKLLVLKILFLLFTSLGTENYFYTNDLKVLVDVFIRELADLPDEQEGLRHTYLRVLYPLLNKTVIKDADYKTLEVHSSLCALVNQTRLRDVSATTARLVTRCLSSDCFENLPMPSSFSTECGPTTPNMVALANDFTTARKELRVTHSTSDLLAGLRPETLPVISTDVDILRESSPSVLQEVNGKAQSPISAPASTTELSRASVDFGTVRRRAPPPPRPSSLNKPRRRFVYD